MFTLNSKGKRWTVDRPLVMGIMNVTPDSFYEGSRFRGIDGILQQAEQMLKEGAAILDLGGQSTRPGSQLLSADEEMQRVLPAIEAVHRTFPETMLSVDTFYAKVAAPAVTAGAAIVNDISGGQLDKDMLPVMGKLQVPYVCMHMKGTPQTMQQHAHYDDVTKEVQDYFIQKIAECEATGITDIIVDPGLGFAKTPAHNFELLKNLSVISTLEKPVLIGVSRKSFIYKTLGITSDEALNGTTVLHTIGLLKGAHILRVHDVKEAVEVVKLVSCL